MRPSPAIALAAILLASPAAIARAGNSPKAEDPAARDEEAGPAREGMDKRLPDLAFDRQPVRDVVDILLEAGGVVIWLDEPPLKKAEIDPMKTLVTMNVKKGQTFKDALAMLTRQMVGNGGEKCVAEPCGAVVVVSTTGGAKAFVERHRSALARVRKAAPKLDRELPEVTFAGVPLGDVIDFLRDVTGASIEVDWTALADAGVRKDQRLTVRASRVKIGQALRLVLDDVTRDKPLDFAASGNRVIVTAASSIPDAEKKLAPQEGL